MPPQRSTASRTRTRHSAHSDLGTEMSIPKTSLSRLASTTSISRWKPLALRWVSVYGERLDRGVSVAGHLAYNALSETDRNVEIKKDIGKKRLDLVRVEIYILSAHQQQQGLHGHT